MTDPTPPLPSIATAINMLDGSTAVVPGDPADISDYYGQEPQELLYFSDIYDKAWFIDPDSICSLQEVDPAAWPTTPIPST
jgi:hypothetical protein